MATPVAEIHSVLSQFDATGPLQDGGLGDNVIMAIELAVAFVVSKYVSVESVLGKVGVPNMFGPNNVIVQLVWFMIVFFAFKYTISKEYVKRQNKKEAM